jgi:hypothetical protein
VALKWAASDKITAVEMSRIALYKQHAVDEKIKTYSRKRRGDLYDLEPLIGHSSTTHAMYS